MQGLNVLREALQTHESRDRISQRPGSHHRAHILRTTGDFSAQLNSNRVALNPSDTTPGPSGGCDSIEISAFGWLSKKIIITVSVRHHKLTVPTLRDAT